MYKFIEHTADMGIEARGKTLDEAIEEIAKGLIVMIFGEVSSLSLVRNDILVSAEEPVEMLVSVLNEIVYHIDIDNLVPAELSIEFLSETEWRGTLTGEGFDAERHHIERQVKSVTYHQARLEQVNEGWLARVYVDL
jgi:SHS2 domain-containing protein